MSTPVARATKSLASTLQMLIDQYKDYSNLFLILCESSMAYVEDNVLAYKAPRKTAEEKVETLLKNADKTTDRMIAEDDVWDLFGLK